MTTSLGLGERAPDFVLPLADGTPTRFYAAAGGRPALLVFCRTAADPAVAEAVETARAADAAAVVVAREPADGLGDDVTVFADSEGRVAAAYRLAADAPVTTFTLDPNLRIAAALQTYPDPQPPVRVAAQAPVLYVPNVLDGEGCALLMQVFTSQGHAETGVERSAAGRREDALAPSAKRRFDHTVTDPQLLKSLTARIGRRVMPELQKAFAYRATRFEGFKIACYEAETAGFFSAHRDNLSPSTAHRRFAMTLNLNDDYDGGELRFPEYGWMRYRPAAGEALLFSCSHLHEVLPVTRGRRFVLLSFLFGE